MANAATPATAPRLQPVHEIRLGMIKAAIWQNATDAGPPYKVTLERLYHQEGEWRSTGSFGRDDLLVLAKAADLAHTWILEPDGSEVENAEKTARNSVADLASKSLPKRPGAVRAG